MEFGKVTIVGLGLIGGSFAKKLNESLDVSEVWAVDTDASVIDYAVKNKVVHAGTTSLAEGVRDAEIVVAATNVRAIAEVVKSASEFVREGTVFTDVGSVKGEIVRELEESLPDGVDFVGAHPIAGTEKSGVRNADPSLFVDKLLILTPTRATDSTAVSKVTALWEIAGARVVAMDPRMHDHIFAFVSHLPHIVAYSLANTVLAQDDPPEMATYSGGGLRDFTRIAASSPEMWRDIFSMNRDNLLSAVRKFKGSLETLEGLIEKGDWAALAKELGRYSEAKGKT